MEVHQVLVAAGLGDAITNEALRLQRELRALGPSEIFAYHRDPEISAVRSLEEFPEPVDHGARILVAHSSIGEKAVFDFLTNRPEPVVVRYHNITPAEFYEPYDPEFALLLRRGREELAALSGRAAKAIAVSEFNRSGLVAAGYERTSVVPLLMDLPQLIATEPAREFWLPTEEEGPLLVFVGRIAPNKGHHRLVQAFHVLKTYLRQDAHMHLIGGRGVDAYTAALELYIRQLVLPDVALTGSVSMPELVAAYRRADIFICLSEHEGFCAPLVEAMSFDVPVIAWNRGAVADTVDGAGLLLDTASPELAAEAVNAVIADPALRSELVEGGRRRVAKLQPEIIARDLVNEILAVV